MKKWAFALAGLALFASFSWTLARARDADAQPAGIKVAFHGNRPVFYVFDSLAISGRLLRHIRELTVPSPPKGTP
jgi:hypothetical protein